MGYYATIKDIRYSVGLQVDVIRFNHAIKESLILNDTGFAEMVIEENGHFSFDLTDFENYVDNYSEEAEQEFYRILSEWVLSGGVIFKWEDSALEKWEWEIEKYSVDIPQYIEARKKEVSDVIIYKRDLSPDIFTEYLKLDNALHLYHGEDMECVTFVTVPKECAN